MWVPHKELKKKINKDAKHVEKQMQQKRLAQRENCFKKKNFSLLLFLRFKENRPSEFVGINTENALRDEGYA